MITIFKLTTGEEVIGRTFSDMTDEWINIEDPMYIVGLREEDRVLGLRLRDAVMLGSDTLMSLPAKYIITTYEPNDMLIAYYNKAIVYNTTYARPSIGMHIQYAIEDIEERMKAEETAAKVLTDMLLKAANTSLQ